MRLLLQSAKRHAERTVPASAGRRGELRPLSTCRCTGTRPMLLSSRPELFASWNFSPNSYFPSFISIENLQIKGGLGAYEARRLCFPQRHLEAISL